MCQLARLLQTLRKENEATNFDDFIDTARFDELVAAVKDLCGFKEESRLDIDVPSLALKLGHSIKQCAQVLKSSSALRKKDEAEIRKCQSIIDLFEAEWTTKISSRSFASLGSKKQNKVEILLLAGDLMLLKNHEKKMADLSKILNKGKETQTAAGHWSSLAKMTLARIIIFNKEDQGRLRTYK